MLKDKQIENKIKAAEFLAIKDGNKVALQVLLDHADQTAYTLARLGRTEAVPYLVKDLRFDNQNVRIKATVALGELGPAARDAIPSLLIANQDPFDSALRKNAKIALDKIKM